MFFDPKSDFKPGLKQKPGSGFLPALVILAMAVSLMIPVLAEAAPEGGQVVSGQAAINQAGKTTNIDQSSPKAAINWQKFNVKVDETVNFNQPSQKAMILNRITGNERSVIDGALTANGQVFIINSAGVLFDRHASVNVGGLVASTLDVSNQDFENGAYIMFGPAAPGQVINKGLIKSRDGGYVALIGGKASNEGVIVAKSGLVTLNSARKVFLNYNEDSLVGVTLEEGTLNTLVENKDAIYADGGQVILSAKAAENILDAQVNNEGLIQAQTLEQISGPPVTGSINLIVSGGTVNVKGLMDVSAPREGDGGTVITRGETINVNSQGKVSALSRNGFKGNWEMEATEGDLILSRDTADGGALSRSLNEANLIIIASGNNADLNIGSDLVWATDSILTLYADRDINIQAGVRASGADAVLSLNYGRDYNIITPASFGGTELNANGVPVAKTDNTGGKYGEIALTGQGAKLLLNTDEYQFIRTLDELLAISGTDGHYALLNDLAFAPGTVLPGSFISLVTSNTVLTGLGHVISNIKISTDSGEDHSNTGFISESQTGSVIRDLGLTDVDIYVPTGTYAGGLIGRSLGTILNVYVTGTVKGNTAGGIAGNQWNGQLIKAVSQVEVENLLNSGMAGGLIGQADSVSIYNSHASGPVKTALQLAGGLAGRSGTINIYNSYASGNVESIAPASSQALYLGGLIGSGQGGSVNIVDSFASGNVDGATIMGGLAGQLGLAGTGRTNIITNSYASGDVTSHWNDSTNIPAYYGIGGLVGLAVGPSSGTANRLTFTDTFATGKVSASVNQENAGGLIGYVRTTISDLLRVYATGEVIVSSAGSTAGGLIGYSFTNANYVKMNVITDSYATGQVTGTDFVGGILGTANYYVTLNNVFSSGDVSGTGYVGGLIGNSAVGNTINDSRALGAVENTGGSGSYTGGLIGFNNDSEIRNSFATGQVTGASGGETGALIGHNNDTPRISDSYYNGETNSLDGIGNNPSYSTGLEGLTSDQIQSELGEQIQVSENLAQANEEIFELAEAANEAAFEESAESQGGKAANDSALSETVTNVENEWQSGESSRNDALNAPADPWQAEVENRNTERQTEISRIEAAEFAVYREGVIRTGTSASGEAAKSAVESTASSAEAPAAASSSSRGPVKAGEYVNGADLNGVAGDNYGDSYSYGVERVDLEGRSFSTLRSAPQNTDDDDEEVK